MFSYPTCTTLYLLVRVPSCFGPQQLARSAPAAVLSGKRSARAHGTSHPTHRTVCQPLSRWSERFSHCSRCIPCAPVTAWPQVTPRMPPRKRSASAPPQRPEGDAPAPARSPATTQTLDGELLELRNGKGYDSADEEDGPGQVLEGEELIGVDEKAPAAEPTPPAQPARPADAPPSPARPSPLRSQAVATGAPQATKKLTEAQQRKLADEKKWSSLKTDNTETRRYARPDFRPFKTGTEPDGFVADPSYLKGGLRPGLETELTYKTHPALFVAAMGWDRTAFDFMKESTNQYAAGKGAGADDFWCEFKPFSLEEIVNGCGFVLRNGVAPSPQVDFVFNDPAQSFVFGDARARKAWPGDKCGGSARRWVQFRSFLHLQSPSAETWKKTDPKTGKFVPLPYGAGAGPLRKCEPFLSYWRYNWQRCYLPGRDLSLDEETQSFKGRDSKVTRIKFKKEGDGYQADVLCEDGYTYTFWFRCDLPPRPVPKDVSDRDDRCSWLAEQLPGQWYRIWMDNLFTSWKFGEMLTVRQCLFGGTCQTADWRGLHSAVVQSEVRVR